MTTLLIEPGDLAPFRATLRAQYDHVRECAQREADQGTNLGHRDAARLDNEADAVLACVTFQPNSGTATIEDEEMLRCVIETRVPEDLDAGDVASLARAAASIAVLRLLAQATLGQRA